MSSRTLALAAPLAAALGLSACSFADGAGSGSAANGDRIVVVASFYPLQFAAEQVGGDRVKVTNLTRPGVEPHDLELTPADVGQISKAEVVVYEKGLQAAVDEAVGGQAKDRALDVAPAAQLDLRLVERIGEHAGAREQAQQNEAGAPDPHFWLDPMRYARVARAMADRLAEVDPAGKAGYESGATAFAGRLTALNTELSSGLASCRNTSLVTSHSAFGYLARAYGLEQVGISGLSPEAEPEPAKLVEVAKYAKAHHVTTIYAEAMVSPAAAEAVAKETGARVAVLDPLEGLTDASAGKDYFEVMRSNLATLQSGQGCS